MWQGGGHWVCWDPGLDLGGQSALWSRPPHPLSPGCVPVPGDFIPTPLVLAQALHPSLSGLAWEGAKGMAG